MSAVSRRQVVQRCPNCSAKYDVGIYVSGQKVRCRRCGIKFAVVRSDTQAGQSQIPGGAPVVAAQALEPRSSYLARLREIVDFKAIKKANLRVVFDPFGGAATL